MKRLIGSLALLLGLIAQPVAAQTAGTATQAAARYAACLVTERPVAADAYLAAALGSPSRDFAFNALVPEGDEVCAIFARAPDGTALQIPEIVLTGHIAEARYVLRYPTGAPPIIATAVPVAMSDADFNARISASPDPVAEFPRIFGDCMVAARGQDIDRLVRTQPGSGPETSMIQAIQPVLGQCLWAGQTLQFSREMLRAVLADALYRKAQGVTAPPPTTGDGSTGGEG